MRGGKRPGAGRPAGAATRRTREIADQALAEGISPLEVMLRAMREHIVRGVSPLQVSYQFAHTFAWENARQRAEAGL